MPEPALSVCTITVAPAALAIEHASITSGVLPEWLQAMTRDFSPRRLGRMISNSRAVYASLANVVAHELLKREATTFTSTVYTAREFCLMAPKSLGEKSLVIACSHSGNTQEVVDGCEMALAAGAEVVAMTDCEGSKIDNGKWITCGTSACGTPSPHG